MGLEALDRDIISQRIERKNWDYEVIDGVPIDRAWEIARIANNAIPHHLRIQHGFRQQDGIGIAWPTDPKFDGSVRSDMVIITDTKPQLHLWASGRRIFLEFNKYALLIPNTLNEESCIQFVIHPHQLDNPTKKWVTENIFSQLPPHKYK
jgi:hypothetical protein